jgi:hypothetical protein
MINPRRIMAHGKLIEIETLETPSMRLRAAYRANKRPRVMIDLTEMAGMTKAAEIPGAMLLIVLQYMVWKTKGPTFPLPNALLKRYGVSRSVKSRTLQKLEAAGRIKLERRRKQSPLVTLI